MHLTTDSENSGFRKVFTPVNLLIWALFSAFILFRYWSRVIKADAMSGIDNGLLIAVLICLFYVFWAFLNQWVLVMLAGLFRLSKPVGILGFLGYFYLISPLFLSENGLLEIRFILAPMAGMIVTTIVSFIVGLFVKDPEGRKGKSGDEKLASAIDHLGDHHDDTLDASESTDSANPFEDRHSRSRRNGHKKDHRDPGDDDPRPFTRG